MEKIRLSKRLQAIAGLVPKGAIVADVGTDHGYLPAWLIQNGVCKAAWATDINAGPLSSARKTARLAGTGGATEFALCDGLSGVPEGAVDTVVIAGMGGETIASILEDAPWTKNGALLILQPQSKSAVLRRFLTSNGYVILSESLANDGRLYQILTASRGENTWAYSDAEYNLGAFGQITGDPLFGEYLISEILSLEKALAGLRSAALPDEERISEAEALLREYDNMKGMLK